MPTIIALENSLSMQRFIPGRSDDNPLTFFQLAQKGITHLLDYLNGNSKLEYVSLVSYSSMCEMKVDFTRDYEQIRQAAKKIEPGDKVCLVSMLKFVSNIVTSNWASQKCQIIIFSDCGIGLGNNSVPNFIKALKEIKTTDIYEDPEFQWLSPLKAVKINLVCMGLQSDKYFFNSLGVYQSLFDIPKIRVQFFTPRTSREYTESLDSVVTSMPVHKSELGRTAMFEIMERVCEINYKPFETILKCGGYFRLECPVILWPPPQPYLNNGDRFTLASKIEICGFLSLTEIGSPVSLSRHLVLAKVDKEKLKNRSSDKNSNSKTSTNPMKYIFDMLSPHNEYERLEQEIRDFFTKDVKYNDDQFDGESSVNRSCSNSPPADSTKESLCVLLHGALKVENLVALVLLNEDWYGYIYCYSDSKKKANLMLNILPPGNNVIPWLGDFRMFGFDKDLLPGEVSQFPVKADKRSYSQSCVVWIRTASLQSDIQKVLRHAKKIPEKLQHFYKELNRIRRHALSLGFLSLLDAMANLFDKESAQLSASGGNPECSLQLQHAAIELRKPSNRDLKISLGPPPVFNPIPTI